MTLDLSEFNTLTKQIEDLQTELKAKAEALVADGTKGFFDEFGDIVESFGWNQWIPGFNDGDPCVFTMGEPWIVGKEDLEKVREEGGEDYVDDVVSDWTQDSGSPSFGYGGKADPTIGYRESAASNPEFDPRYRAAEDSVNALYKVMSTGDLAEQVFGENAQVIFTKSGVDVDYYECGY